MLNFTDRTGSGVSIVVWPLSNKLYENDWYSELTNATQQTRNRKKSRERVPVGIEMVYEDEEAVGMKNWFTFYFNIVCSY